MVIAKVCLLKGLIQENAQEKQYRYYKLSGMILIVACAKTKTKTGNGAK